MLGSKKFDVDDSDHIIIDGVRYAGTPDIYQLIFKRVPDYDVYTDVTVRRFARTRKREPEELVGLPGFAAGTNKDLTRGS